MPFDRHRVWRAVQHISTHLEQHPRDGYEPMVEVFISGRADPVVVYVAETRRDPNYPWVKLYTGDAEGSYVFAHEAYIERVEVSYRPVKGEPGPVGFRAEIAADDGSAAGSAFDELEAAMPRIAEAVKDLPESVQGRAFDALVTAATGGAAAAPEGETTSGRRAAPLVTISKDLDLAPTGKKSFRTIWSPRGW